MVYPKKLFLEAHFETSQITVLNGQGHALVRFGYFQTPKYRIIDMWNPQMYIEKMKYSRPQNI